jgi:chorismate mutase
MRLDMLRKQIDLIDNQILLLLSKRVAVAKKIKSEKSKTGLPASDPVREKEIRKRLSKLAVARKLEKSFVLNLFQTIIAYSKKVQKI